MHHHCHDIQVHWSVVGPANQEQPDVTPTSGIVVISDGSSKGVVTFDLLADNIAELEESFTVVLTEVEGGAELDQGKTSAAFLVG